MNNQRVELTGWQIAAIAVGVLVIALTCCFLGLMVGGVTGFGMGRASVQLQPTPRWPIVPFPGFPTPGNPTPALTPGPEERPYLGVRYVMRPRGAEVVEVIPDSPAEEAGLQVGDLIREVDGRRVSTSHPLAELLSFYRPGDRVTLKVERDGDELPIEVTLGRWPAP